MSPTPPPPLPVSLTSPLPAYSTEQWTIRYGGPQRYKYNFCVNHPTSHPQKRDGYNEKRLFFFFDPPPPPPRPKDKVYFFSFAHTPPPLQKKKGGGGTKYL